MLRHVAETRLTFDKYLIEIRQDRVILPNAGLDFLQYWRTDCQHLLHNGVWRGAKVCESCRSQVDFKKMLHIRVRMFLFYENRLWYSRERALPRYCFIFSHRETFPTRDSIFVDPVPMPRFETKVPCFVAGGERYMNFSRHAIVRRESWQESHGMNYSLTTARLRDRVLEFWDDHSSVTKNVCIL